MQFEGRATLTSTRHSKQNTPNPSNGETNMSMYQKNNKIDMENIENFVAAKVFAACVLICLFFTPLFFFFGLILEGVSLAILGTISWLSKWLLEPGEEIGTKLKVKERINYYLRPYSPCIQFLSNLFMIGVTGTLLGQLPIPLFRLFDILCFPLIPLSILGFVLLAFWGFESRDTRKRNTYKR